MRFPGPCTAIVVSIFVALEACSASDATPSTPRPSTVDAACSAPEPETDAGDNPPANDETNNRVTTNDRVLANLFMRHVLEGRLIDDPNEEPSVITEYYMLLEALVEGRSDADVNLTRIDCSPAVVTSTCTLLIGRPIAEVGYTLDVEVTKGRFGKAKMRLFAG